MNIVEFLTARFDEDYEIAYSGAPSPWTIGDRDGTFDGSREILDRLGDVTARAYYGGTAGHLEHFDPTRVLRMNTVMREVLNLHESVPYYGLDRYGRWMSREGEPQRWYCECQAEDGLIRGEEPCETKRILAQPYRDHEDFDPSWLAASGERAQEGGDGRG